MKLATILTGIIALAAVVMTAEAITTDFWTWHDYRSTIETQRAQIKKLEADLLEYQQTVTDLKHAALAAK